MTSSVEQTALMRFLKATNDTYYGKALEVREAIQGWLQYVPQTFGHYTAHSIQHSDEIISQISLLLFEQNDPDCAVVRLTGAEAYILVAAAYLHDAGMVVSDREKAGILTSDSWTRWTTEGGGAKRWAEIQERRNSADPPDEALRAFLADIQTRFLLAEFVRRTHHRRAGAIIDQHEATLGRFAFGDPALQNTISAVCVSHGLASSELRDQEKYPDRRTVRGDLVNVRFLAIVLRLGDLLDTSYNRACPLLLNAACPLPADSLAHWTKYQRIVHRLTAPDTIELTAECKTQDEHRFLQDWCQWLADETREARTLMARAARHGSWKPPLADLGSTIQVKPASGATYIPSRWAFELDHDLVFERLIRDVHDEPYAFVRELIQNALDASRCKMYADLVEEGLQPPEYPTQVEHDRRQRYGISVSLREERTVNELSGESEPRHVLVVEDRGIGMDREIIEHFFLQVGRSYYATEEFRRFYPFVPTSRFGVGFLSVFAASDRVTVETCKPSSPAADGPIRMVLTGPRNYLLTDRGERRLSGTRIEVWLTEPVEPGRLTEAVSGWCKRVEFPVAIDDLGAQVVVTADQPDAAPPTVPDLDEEGAHFTIRVFPVNRPGIEGELYVFAHVDARGESWDARYWAMQSYAKKHPLPALPEPPGQYVCLHGVRISSRVWPDTATWRTASMQLDVRRAWPSLSLARAHLRSYDDRDVWAGSDDDPFSRELKTAWEELMTQHLSTSPRAQSPSGWRYKQSLIEHFPFRAFWALQPDMIRLHEHGRPRTVGLQDIQAMPVLTTMFRFGGARVGKSAPADEAVALAGGLDHPAIIPDDLNATSKPHRQAIFGGRRADQVRWLSEGFAAIDWVVDGPSWDPWSTVLQEWEPLQSASLPDPAAIAVSTHITSDNLFECVLLNSDHPFCGWFSGVAEAAKQAKHGMDEKRFQALAFALSEAARGSKSVGELKSWLDAWRQVEGLPPELQVPEIELTDRAFTMKRQEGNASLADP